MFFLPFMCWMRVVALGRSNIIIFQFYKEELKRSPVVRPRWWWGGAKKKKQRKGGEAPTCILRSLNQWEWISSCIRSMYRG